MKKGRIFIFVFLLVFSFSYKISFAQNSTNAGFIPSNIWYSKDPFEEGDNIKIYTLVFNSDSRQLSGSVLFFDNDVLLGKRNFTAGSSQVSQVGLPWQVTVGDHTIFAKIESTRYLTSNGTYVDVYLPDNQSDTSKRTVNKKIDTVANTDTNTTTNNPIKDSSNSLVNTIDDKTTSVANTIKDNAPTFISKPVAYVVDGVESFRQSVENKTTSFKDKIKSNIQTIKDNIKNGASNASEKGKSKLSKPFEYIKLFFAAILSAIFDFKIIFYGLSVLVIFFVLRYIWRKWKNR
ncbi:MAG: hypothetical protein NTW62_03200 [Candidatus Nomurabacteria bacterium]|nr:hypothetical protein [Candidatus Nomurabacteria bacterium]